MQKNILTSSFDQNFFNIFDDSGKNILGKQKFFVGQCYFFVKDLSYVIRPIVDKGTQHF